MKPREWNRVLWGVMFTSGREDAPLLLGQAWNDPQPQSLYPGEPTRTLVFTTRKDARAWCRARREKYRERTDCCALWRFTPVRVRERVSVEHSPAARRRG